MHLISNTAAYNQTILQSYSKNCRANFGDSRCKIDKTMYSTLYNIEEIFGKTIRISNLNKEDGYFMGGDVNFGEGAFCAKVANHTQNILIVDKVIPDNIKYHKTARITAGCDKNFITCCNKFQNAVNFRGEPFLPDDRFIKL